MTITTLIIIATCVFSAAAFQNEGLVPESFRRPEWTDKYKFNAYLISHEKQYYRFFGYGFVHAGIWHLAFNMLTLYFFGGYLESAFSYVSESDKIGKIWFLILYITALPVSVLLDYFRHKNHSYYNAVGASGAVSAVLFAVIFFNPSIPINFMFIPIPIPGWLFGILYLAYCVYMDKKGIDNIGHSAHFMGAVYGLIFPVLTKPSNINIFLQNLPF
ncbi:MAG: rhomboid family intramembrane serine protease [Bacteroidales bacterium]|nr:rhomboid family intramembrane serine protease [Bacteroidales bacterium]